ncbi:MAG: 3'-5' exonuclease [Bdellovibrionales bacterium]
MENGEFTERFNALIKPTQPMDQFVIDIHNITNEMVADAPPISEVIGEFHEFIQDGTLVAHHAPFDMGFLAYEFEKVGLGLPKKPVVCSSLYSRFNLSGVENFRLQTLVKHFNIDGGQAHRATDDAEACLKVLLMQLESHKNSEELTVPEIMKLQGRKLSWFEYSIEHLRQFETTAAIVEALEMQLPLAIIYKGGSRPGQMRTILAEGIVRNPNGDYLVAKDFGDEEGQSKRFYLSRIKEASVNT